MDIDKLIFTKLIDYKGNLNIIRIKSIFAIVEYENYSDTRVLTIIYYSWNGNERCVKMSKNIKEIYKKLAIYLT